MEEKKTIGVLTSGGDAPGMNAAIRAVVRAGLNSGFSVCGIRRGYQGLLERDIFEMDLRSVSHILERGGTMLYSSRCPDFAEDRNIKKAIEILKEFGIDVLVVIGGDGSFRGAKRVAELGFPCIGIPATIDNDIACTEYTIGFDTAINTVVQMVDRVRDTSQSHDRCSVIEVMGREAGYIALEAGIACGAISILVPENGPLNIERDVIAKMVSTLRTGKQNFIVIAAEGVGHAPYIAEKIEQLTGVTTNAVVLGYVQRGGTPTAKERVLATLMGEKAVELAKQNLFNCVVAIKCAKVCHYSFDEALNMKKTLDADLLRLSEEVSV